jgi:4-hydroxybenzoate polyprenyltransferase
MPQYFLFRLKKLATLFLEYLIFSSLFITICAVVMAMETSWLLYQPLLKPAFYCFIGGSTLLHYSLHYWWKQNEIKLEEKKRQQTSTLEAASRSVSPFYRSPRLQWSTRHAHHHLFWMAVGFVGVVYGLTQFEFKHLPGLIGLGVLALLYSVPVLPSVVPKKKGKRLKDYGLLKILVLSATWTLVTVWLPLAEGSWTADSTLIVIRRFAFLFALCLLFDIRDATIDEQKGIRTLPVRMGTKNAYRLVYFSLGAMVLLSVIALFLQPGDKALVHANAMMLSAGATAFMAQWSKNNQTEQFYLLAVDGMMILQALLVWMG